MYAIFSRPFRWNTPSEAGSPIVEDEPEFTEEEVEAAMKESGCEFVTSDQVYSKAEVRAECAADPTALFVESADGYGRVIDVEIAPETPRQQVRITPEKIVVDNVEIRIPSDSIKATYADGKLVIETKLRTAPKKKSR